MIILGIDPGIATTGFGVLAKEGDRLKALDYGAIRTSPQEEAPDRLYAIFEAVGRLMDLHQPDQLVTERLFFGKNETNALVVGRTLGVVLLAAAQRDIPWIEYQPALVKQAVVGYGNADKHQVQFMIQRLLGLTTVPKPDDAADALAIAICHAHSVVPYAGG